MCMMPMSVDPLHRGVFVLIVTARLPYLFNRRLLPFGVQNYLAAVDPLIGH